MPDWYPRAVEALAEGTAGSYFGIFAMKCTQMDKARRRTRILSHGHPRLPPPLPPAPPPRPRAGESRTVTQTPAPRPRVRSCPSVSAADPRPDEARPGPFPGSLRGVPRRRPEAHRRENPGGPDLPAAHGCGYKTPRIHPTDNPRTPHGCTLRTDARVRPVSARHLRPGRGGGRGRVRGVLERRAHERPEQGHRHRGARAWLGALATYRLSFRCSVFSSPVALLRSGKREEGETPVGPSAPPRGARRRGSSTSGRI